MAIVRHIFHVYVLDQDRPPLLNVSIIFLSVVAFAFSILYLIISRTTKVLEEIRVKFSTKSRIKVESIRSNLRTYRLRSIIISFNEQGGTSRRVDSVIERHCMSYFIGIENSLQ